MALGPLISLVFRRKRLATSMLRFPEILNYPNHIRGRDSQAFPLPSQNRPYRHRNSPAAPPPPPGRNRNGLAEMTTRPSLALGIAAEFGLQCRSGVQRDVRFRADDRHRPDTTCAVRKARARRCGGRPAARVYALDLQLCGRFWTGSGAANQLIMIDIGHRTPSQ